jgi:hypothetical protein
VRQHELAAIHMQHRMHVMGHPATESTP